MSTVHTKTINKSFLKLGHECVMSADEDLILKKYPGVGMCSNFKRGYVRSILVNEGICRAAATSTMSIRSYSAIRSEMKRQLEEYPSSIHPFSTFKFFFDFFIIVVTLVQIVTVCFDLAYYNFTETAPYFSSTTFMAVRNIIDLISCTNIFVSARTGYYDEIKKVVVLDLGKTFRHYVKNGFIFDLLTSFPTHLDLFIDLREAGPKETCMEVLQGMSTLKLLRYPFIHASIEKIAKTFNMNFYLRNICTLSIGIAVCWLSLSCFMIFGYVVLDDRKNTFTYMNSTFALTFGRMLYDGALILYTSSYGVDPPETTLQILMTNVQWIVAKTFQIILLAKILSILKARNSPHMKYSQMVKQIIEFMRHKHLPLYTQRRILSYYEYHYQKCYFRENDIYGTISGQLRQEIMMQTCRNLVQNVEFFHDIPINLLIRIVTCLKSEIYLTNDLIIKAGTIGKSMYFIATGTVAIYTKSMREVCHLEDGAHFGEVALVNPDVKRVATVLAVETCQLYRLDKKDFVRAIYPYPDLLEKIQKVAMFRMEMTVMMETAADKIDDLVGRDSKTSNRMIF